jgi:Asp-tRNA(Asn)/Glu-tRNA(Gln) amidotransferase A subunit family amidase
LNAFTLLNPAVFNEAEESDRRRALGQPRALEGIPFSIKDSYKYEGMTVSVGSKAFHSLMSNETAFIVAKLREAGGICFGKTNMPPMAAGGMQRGIYGRAENPYNPEYLAAAFRSGSSNGSGTSTAASFAAFGLGSETVSSGRSPASNNALVAYTPSKGIISCRGLWPLYPTCDVVVPHTRTMDDLFAILGVIMQPDSETDGDFWRKQEFVKLPEFKLESIASLSDTGSLRGKRLAVPSIYIGGVGEPKAKPVHVSDSVKELWQQAKVDLEAMGAEVIETDFPLVTNYEDDSVSQQPNNVVGAPEDWNAIERGKLIAYTWDDFLAKNGDPNFPGLASANGDDIFPVPQGYIPDIFMEAKNMIPYGRLSDYLKGDRYATLYDTPGMKEAVVSLEAQRKRDLEDWMDKNGYDAVVFPANGDVGKADLEFNEQSARLAHLNGVRYSNGNRALRHLGVPTVSVTMGLMKDTKVPVNLTFAGRGYTDNQLLKYAYAFEQKTKRRVAPILTPELSSDIIRVSHGKTLSGKDFPSHKLTVNDAVKSNENGKQIISVGGNVSVHDEVPAVEVFIDSIPAEVSLDPATGDWTATGTYTNMNRESLAFQGSHALGKDSMVVVLGRYQGGVKGHLSLVN